MTVSELSVQNQTICHGVRIKYVVFKGLLYSFRSNFSVIWKCMTSVQNRRKRFFLRWSHPLGFSPVLLAGYFRSLTWQYWLHIDKCVPPNNLKKRTQCTRGGFLVIVDVFSNCFWWNYYIFFPASLTISKNVKNLYLRRFYLPRSVKVRVIVNNFDFLKFRLRKSKTWSTPPSVRKQDSGSQNTDSNLDFGIIVCSHREPN